MVAPCPTATVDGLTVYAAPSKSGQPRNAWLAVHVRKEYGIEEFGGAEREAVKRRMGKGPWVLIERDAHTWTPTPARKCLF